MALTLSPEHFQRLVGVVSARPSFANPITRFPFVTALLQPSPRAAVLHSTLHLSIVSTRSDAVSLVQHLLTFGQDVAGREALTLLVCALLDDVGEGDERDFVVSLFETYPLENPNAGKPITILFITANSTETARLQLDVEQREIDDALLKSRYRERFTLESRPALRSSDLQEALLRYTPSIAHFSGHGADEGLIFADQRVDPAAVAELFRLLTPRVQVVLLNACYSADQAEQMARYVGCVIGMTRAIPDLAAIQFATAFYRALGYGANVQTAYDLGVNQIKLAGLPGATTPILLCAAGDATTIKLI